MGRLTKDKYGFSGPVWTPLYPPPINFYRNQETLLVYYEADPDAVLDILPEGVDLLTDPPVVQYMIHKTPISTFGPHCGAYLFPGCQFEGKPYYFEHFLMVTSDSALCMGREFWGDSKKICHIEFIWEHNELVTTVERPKGLRLITTHFRIEKRLDPKELPEDHPGLCLKYIPSAEEGAPPCVHQLVSDDLVFTPIVGADGKPEVYTGVGSLIMNTETDVIPLYKLKPLRMLGTYYIIGNMDLHYGRVLKNF